MSKIQVHSGKMLDLLDPDVSELQPTDYTIPLSRIPRFGGHLNFTWTVMHHSLLAARLARAVDLPESVVKGVALHDASEAFMGDVVKPLKNLLGEAYTKLENNLQAKINDHFRVDIAKTALSLYKLDTVCLVAEAKLLFDHTPHWTDAHLVAPTTLDEASRLLLPLLATPEKELLAEFSLFFRR